MFGARTVSADSLTDSEVKHVPLMSGPSTNEMTRGDSLFEFMITCKQSRSIIAEKCDIPMVLSTGSVSPSSRYLIVVMLDDFKRHCTEKSPIAPFYTKGDMTHLLGKGGREEFHRLGETSSCLWRHVLSVTRRKFPHQPPG